MATTAPTTVPMIHLVSLLTPESYHGRVAARQLALWSRCPSARDDAAASHREGPAATPSAGTATTARDVGRPSGVR